MGEAKRRKSVGNIRPTGLALSEFMMDMDKYSGHVACGSCRACCYHPNVNITADDDASRYDTEIRADGVTYLKRKPNGSCVHLGVKGCEVYEHRPSACRTFDCRLYSALGIGVEFNRDRGDVQKAPNWIFKSITAHDLLWASAADIAVTYCKPGSDADVVLAYLTKNLEIIIEQAYAKLMQTYPTLKQTIVQSLKRRV